MKSTALALSFLLAAPAALLAQSAFSTSLATSPLVAEELSTAGGGVSGAATAKTQPATVKPLSRIALSGGISLMGINLQAATNLNRFLNVRGVGNVFNYNVNNISTNGFNVNGKLNFATAGASLDFYPFPKHGFRLSPGVLFYNQNNVTASGTVAGGNSITLDDVDYYSSTTNPITVNANLGLNTRKQAFTMTTGWGNMISRKSGHWSFPLEIGAAFVGVPSINMGLTGAACLDSAQTECGTLNTTNPQDPSYSISQEVSTNLNAQIAKWKNDLNPLKAYPIFSFGVSYNFRIR